MINEVTLTAKRTDCMSGLSTQHPVTLVIEDGKAGLVVRIIKGGVTGYESFYLSSWNKHPPHTDWIACVGTKGRWDRLEISSEEMSRGLKALTEKERVYETR